MVGDTRVARCGAVWAAVTLGTAALLPWLTVGLPTAPPDDAAAGVVAGCTAAAVGCLAWLWVLTTLVVLDVLRGRSAARRGVPPAVRRWVLVACGVSLASGLLAPAHAERGASDRSRPPQSSAASALLVGLPVPDRATTTTQWLGLLARPRERPTPAAVVVAAGDTLWDLAAHTLPAAADDAEIERRWRQIYRANRDVVGADPDLIRPGQRLLLPLDRPDQHA